MIKFKLILVITFILSSSLFAKTWIVDQNGLGDFNTIMAAVNVAKPGDVVKVNPGIYNEKVVLAKEIIVEGSGAESTIISNQNNDYAVEISAGKIRWFAITSQGTGVMAKGGILTNCIMFNCAYMGVDCYNNSKIINCIATKNQITGFYIKYNQNPIILNCISTFNRNQGYDVENGGQNIGIQYCNSWGNGSNWRSKAYYAYPSTGSLEVDPQFQPNSYQISAGSPCKDAGNPAYQDPDGTRADMGYYGGPDAPTFPVLRNSLIKLNEDGTIQLEAIGISPY